MVLHDQDLDAAGKWLVVGRGLQTYRRYLLPAKTTADPPSFALSVITYLTYPTALVERPYNSARRRALATALGNRPCHCRQIRGAWPRVQGSLLLRGPGHPGGQCQEQGKPSELYEDGDG